MIPDEKAREKIDGLLHQCGWIVQDRAAINLSASLGVAIREGAMKTGEADYLLFADGKAIGTVEAKPEGHTLTGVEEQSGKYGKGLLDKLPAWGHPLPFAYESTGVETQFTSRLDPSPKVRNVVAFHRPETLVEWVIQSGSGIPPLRSREESRDGSATLGTQSGSGVPPLMGKEESRDGSTTLGTQSGSGVPPLRGKEESRDGSATLVNYFNPEEPVAFLTGTLPHWRQEGTTYFVTFRLADALPQEKLILWRREREEWMKAHPEPHDEVTRKAYFESFPQRIQDWLDAGSGSCVLNLPEERMLVESALRHFDGRRYRLVDFVVAANHVHVLVALRDQYTLSEILHSWKSFTAHKLLKLSTVSERLKSTTVWQKESFDHIVRSPASLEKFRAYIRAHREYRNQNESGSGIPPLRTREESRDGSSTLDNQGRARRLAGTAFQIWR